MKSSASGKLHLKGMPGIEFPAKVFDDLEKSA